MESYAYVHQLVLYKIASTYKDVILSLDCEPPPSIIAVYVLIANAPYESLSGVTIRVFDSGFQIRLSSEQAHELLQLKRRTSRAYDDFSYQTHAAGHRNHRNLHSVL